MSRHGPQLGMMACARAATCGAWLWTAGAPAGVDDGPRCDLARFVPARGLASYVESDGLVLHDAAWRRTAAHQILAGTSAGRVLADSARQAFDRLQQLVPGNPFTGEAVVAFQDQLTQHGFALATLRDGVATYSVAIAPNLGGAEAADRVRSLLLLLSPGVQPLTDTPANLRGRAAHVSDPPAAGGFMGLGRNRPSLAWWMEGTTLVAVRGPEADVGAFVRDPDAATRAGSEVRDRGVSAVLDAIEGKAPAAAALPVLAAARAEGADIAGFEPTGLAIAETADQAGVLGSWLGAADRDAPAPGESVIAEILGVTRARRVVVRWGFRGEALLTACRFEAFEPGRATGGVFDPAGFRRDRLPPIPHQAGAFLVAAPTRSLPPSLSTLPPGITVNDWAAPYVEAAKLVVADPENRRAFDGLIRTLGPAVSVHAAPGSPTGRGSVPTFLAEVADPAAAGRALEALVGRLNAFFRAQEPVGGDGAAGSPALVFERLPGPGIGFGLASPAGRVPWLSDSLRPTVMLGRSTLVVAANPAVARAAVATERDPRGGWEPTTAAARAWECLPANLTFLSVGNPRDSFWPEAITSLTATAAPALARFVGVDPGLIPAAPPAGLLPLLGIKPAALDRDGKPLRAEDLRALIFPSIYAATVDTRGVRILALEALPLGCVGVRVVAKDPRHPMALTIEPTFEPSR